MGLGLQHWAGDSSHFSLEYYNVCLSKAPVLSMAESRQLSLGAPGEPSTAPAPPHPHPAQSAYGFFTFLMEKDLEANFLHFLCSKRETGKKFQEQ